MWLKNTIIFALLSAFGIVFMALPWALIETEYTLRRWLISTVRRFARTVTSGRGGSG
jgi:hypothetical protein